MDVALLLLLPLVGGHVFATNWLCSRFRVARDSGNRLYLSAIFYGTFCFIVALLIRLWWIAHPDWVNKSFNSTLLAGLQFLVKPVDQPYEISILVVALLAFCIGLIGWFPLNLAGRLMWRTLRIIPDHFLSRLNISRIALMLPPMLWNATKNDDVSALIYMAMLRPIPVSITIDNRKVYIGFVSQTPDPCQERKAISLFPLISGYRNDSDGRLMLTTQYQDVYERLLSDPNNSNDVIDDFRLTIPLHRICTISLFDIVAYSHFQKSRKPIKKSQRKNKKSSAKTHVS